MPHISVWDSSSRKFTLGPKALNPKPQLEVHVLAWYLGYPKGAHFHHLACRRKAEA